MAFFRPVSSSHVRALCAQRSAAGYSSPLYARMSIWDCARRLPPDWAHTCPPLHRDQVQPPTHTCNWTESIPCPPLPCERVHPLPTSAPQPNPSPADLCATPAALRDICLCATPAQHRCDAAAQHTVLQPHAPCGNRVPPVNDPAADGTCCNRLHAAALHCDWLHPI